MLALSRIGNLRQLRIQLRLRDHLAENGGVRAFRDAFHAPHAMLAVQQRNLGRNVGKITQRTGAGADDRTRRGQVGGQPHLGRTVVVGADDPVVEVLDVDHIGVDGCTLPGREVMHGDADVDLAHYPDGAFDYVLKPFSARELLARVRTHVTLSRTRRDRARFALQAAGVGTWDIDLASGRTSWSPVLEQLHGLAPGAFAGTLDAFLSLVEADDRDRVRSALAATATAALAAPAGARSHESTFTGTPGTSPGGAYRVEYRVMWPDGSVHWIATVGRVLAEATVPL